MLAPVHSHDCRGRPAWFPPALHFLLPPRGPCCLLPRVPLVKHRGEPESIQHVGAPIRVTRIHRRSVAPKGGGRKWLCRRARMSAGTGGRCSFSAAPGARRSRSSALSSRFRFRFLGTRCPLLFTNRKNNLSVFGCIFFHSFHQARGRLRLRLCSRFLPFEARVACALLLPLFPLLLLLNLFFARLSSRARVHV